MKFIAAAAGALALFGTTALAQVPDAPDDPQQTEIEDMPQPDVDPLQPGEGYTWTMDELTAGPWTFAELVLVFPSLTEAHFEDMDADSDGRVSEDELMGAVEAGIVAPPADQPVQQPVQ